MPDYRSLGRTGVQVSPLCLGCMNFGGRTDLEDSVDIIHAALDRGINFLDTANVYSRGESEKVVGEALARGNHRDRTVLATKFHGRMADDDPNALGNHRRHIVAACEASLKRLKTDHVDLYQVHRPDPSVPIDETLRALDDLVRAGKVRYIGTSTYAAWQVLEALQVAKDLGLNRFVTEQPPYHLLDRRIERELVPMAQTYGLALLPWSPLAGGLLTGKYDREGKTEGQARLEKKDEGRAAELFSDAAFDVVDVLREIADGHGCTPSQAALAWCRDQPGVTSPIIGPRTMEQLEDNLGAREVTLTDEDREKIDAVNPPGRAIAHYYEADFGPHAHRVG